MPIDPSIPLATRTPEAPDLIKPVAQAFELRNLQQRGQAEQLQLSQALQESQERQSVKEILSGADFSTQEGQQEALKKITAKSPELGMKLSKEFQDTAKTKADLTKAQLGVFKEQTEILTDAFGSLASQYDDMVSKGVSPAIAQARLMPMIQDTFRGLAGQKLADGSPVLGPEQMQGLNKLLTNFDPNRLHQLAAQGMKYKDVMDQKLKQLEFGEKKRHDVAEESVQSERNKILREKSEAGALDDDTLKFMAKQYLSGDTSVKQNLGRGAQGAQNISKLLTFIRREASDQGLSPSQVASKVAEFQGVRAGERTLGTRTAQIGMSVAEAKSIMPLVIEASEKVDRTDYPTLNKVVLAAEKGTGGEDVVRLASAVNAAVNVYSRAISPTGTPTVSDKEHARDILEAAYSKGQIKAAIDQMSKEMTAAQKAPGQVRQEFQEAVTGAKPPQNAPGSDQVIEWDDLDASKGGK